MTDRDVEVDRRKRSQEQRTDHKTTLFTAADRATGKGWGVEEGRRQSYLDQC